jgi:alpha-galactosidase
MSIQFDEKTRSFHLSGQRFSYCLKVAEDGQLLNLYWGARLPQTDLSYLLASFAGGASFDMAEYRLPIESVSRGSGFFGAPLVQAVNEQGDDLTQLRYVSHEIVPGKPALDGLPAVYTESDDEAETLMIRMRDELTGLCAELRYTVMADYDVLTRAMVLKNEGQGELLITGAQSANVPMYGDDYQLIHLHGGWARERSVQRMPVGKASIRVQSLRGASSHEQNPFVALVKPETTEFSGEAWAMNLVYSGSFQAGTDVNNRALTRLFIGLNPETNRWLLASGDMFTAPEAVLVYSDAGLNAMSQKYHALYRSRLCRGKWRDAPRPVLINNWEGTYFNFDEEKILEIARRAREIEVELFVLDDGWFGKRDQDNCSLGDWVVDRRKLPGGIDGLARKINEMGLKFGLWFEPEMVSPDSDLYRAHPDWCLHVEGRARSEARQQLILDLSRREVQDYIIEAVSAVLRSAPISYVKWDMNRNMTEAFNCTLPAGRKMETQHRYMLGLYRVLDEIVSAFPDVLFESCSGGGGRFDAGMLYYMPQTWTSDDTDPMERLKIQYGTSMAYPPSAMGAHVSASPNHQTARVSSMRTRGEVAIGGNFGFELDLSKLSPEDLATAKELVREVKAIRQTVQQGVFTRLCSPFEENFAAWQFISPDGEQAVLCAYRRLAQPDGPVKRFTLRDLAPDALYRDEQSGTVYPGAVLMHAGLPVQFDWGDYQSRVIRFRKIS